MLLRSKRIGRQRQRFEVTEVIDDDKKGIVVRKELPVVDRS